MNGRNSTEKNSVLTGVYGTGRKLFRLRDFLFALPFRHSTAHKIINSGQPKQKRSEIQKLYYKRKVWARQWTR